MNGFLEKKNILSYAQNVNLLIGINQRNERINFFELNNSRLRYNAPLSINFKSISILFNIIKKRQKMVYKVVSKFEVQYLQILDESGKIDEKLMPKLSNDDIKAMYEFMILIRKFDEKCISLQRQGRMGTYAAVLGQEASQVGSAYALSKEDWMFPSFRESGSLIVRNTPMYQIMMYWAGDERGQKFSQNVNNFPISIPVGTQIPHAVGAAFASKYLKHKVVSLVYFGDGGSSKGDFHEALNFAGVLKLPCVFICQNNQWAISLPRKQQTASETIAQKAISYGFQGIQVDGNDIFAVYKATKEALDKARSGKGPTLIECVTYRMSDHTTADDASRYRDLKELEAWKKKDPVDRLRKYMESKKLWTQDYEDRILSKSTNQVEEAVKEMESQPAPSFEDFFRNTFADIPPILKEQLDYLSDIKKQKEGKNARKDNNSPSN